MARSSATLDSFTAIAEPRRRRLLEALDHRSMTVNELVGALGWPQPSVSKHLGVLRSVGLVKVKRAGREMNYQVNPEAIRTVHEWAGHFEHLWSRQLDRIKARAEHRAA